MGADMLLAFTLWPANARELAAERLAAMSDDDLTAIADEWVLCQSYDGWADFLNNDMILGEVVSWDGDEEGETPDAAVVADYMRNLLARCLRVDERRDVSIEMIEGKPYLFTGGLSHGDTPTDAYDMVCLLDVSGITRPAPVVEEPTFVQRLGAIYLDTDMSAAERMVAMFDAAGFWWHPDTPASDLEDTGWRPGEVAMVDALVGRCFRMADDDEDLYGVALDYAHRVSPDLFNRED